MLTSAPTPKPRAFPSKLDLGSELNDPLGWNFEVIRGTDSIARHEGEQRLAPQREGRMDAWDRKKETFEATKSRPVHSLGRLINVVAPEEIVEPADSVPPVAIGFDHQPVLPALVGMTVILG